MSIPEEGARASVTGLAFTLNYRTTHGEILVRNEEDGQEVSCLFPLNRMGGAYAALGHRVTLTGTRSSILAKGDQLELSDVNSFRIYEEPAPEVPPHAHS
jgi:hypothetical protein